MDTTPRRKECEFHPTGQPEIFRECLGHRVPLHLDSHCDCGGGLLPRAEELATSRTKDSDSMRSRSTYDPHSTHGAPRARGLVPQLNLNSMRARARGKITNIIDRTEQAYDAY